MCQIFEGEFARDALPWERIVFYSPSMSFDSLFDAYKGEREREDFFISREILSESSRLGGAKIS